MRREQKQVALVQPINRRYIIDGFRTLIHRFYFVKINGTTVLGGQKERREQIACSGNDDAMMDT